MAGHGTHEALVGGQFGVQAAAYLTSAVHAQGPDLAALAEIARAMPRARVLDMGCGGGHASYAVAPHVAEVVAYDLSPEMLAVVGAAAADKGLGNLSIRQGRAEHLPFEDGGFDLVVSRLSAHHWQDVAAGLREAARVLAPGGTFCLIDIVSPGTPLVDTFLQAIELLRDISHVRDYSRGEWEAMIAAAGLSTIATRHNRMQIGFDAWVARMSTPPDRVAAIRALQAAMPAEVAAAFGLGPDGSFGLDNMLFQAVKPAA